ncbi:MAG: DUF1538 domain-containing protein [Eubacterium sp.]|jgi:hypothetical protein|nr:DUF1538 domain-containing protein [Eubacterium sp.]
MLLRRNIIEKIRESLAAVLPITLIVFFLSVTIVPLSGEMLFTFTVGSVMLIIGIGLFTLGADTSMIIMGERIGANIMAGKKIPIILLTCLAIGMLITIAEPDLRVLANQAPIVDTMTLIFAVAVGVGVFLLLAFLRMFLQIKISFLFVGFYILVFALALLPLLPNEFVPVAFDSGGVTTGPITVPFIMSLGVGLAAVRGDKTSQEDSFGLVALCSIGPILTVLVLGIFSGNTEVVADTSVIPEFNNVREAFVRFLFAIPHYFADVAVAVLPIIVLCLGYQFIKIKMDKKSFIKVLIGFLFTYIGLVLFLTGVNVGFMPVGQYMGEKLAGGEIKWILIPLGAVMGYFIVAAEPAVHTLKQQVEDVTEGGIKGKSLVVALSIGVAASVALSMIRVLTGISIFWFLIPGYTFSLIMTFFVPPIFASIAFDSGGVASGPMTATFLLPFAMGVCNGVGGNIAEDAFGVVAMVAMTPLITIQIFGLIIKIKSNAAKSEEIAILPKENEDIFDVDIENPLIDEIVDA